MPNTRLVAAPATVRCCAARHVGPRLLPAAAFSPSQALRGRGVNCIECRRDWAREKRARLRGEVAADVGPDYTALAEAQLYPGRAYAELTPAERWEAIEIARSLAIAAGVYPATPVGEAAHA